MDDAEKEKIRAAFAYMGPGTQAGLTLEALAKGAGILIKDLRAGNLAQADSLRNALLRVEGLEKQLRTAQEVISRHVADQIEGLHCVDCEAASDETCDCPMIVPIFEAMRGYEDPASTEKRVCVCRPMSYQAGVDGNCIKCKLPIETRRCGCGAEVPPSLVDKCERCHQGLC